MPPAEAPAEGDAGTDRPDEPQGTADLVDATVILGMRTAGCYAEQGRRRAWAGTTSTLRRGGIGPPGWTPHWLRHSHATALLLAGTPEWVVSRRLGHAHVQTTPDHYGWVADDEAGTPHGQEPAPYHADHQNRHDNRERGRESAENSA